MKFQKVNQLVDAVKTNVNFAGVVLKIHAPPSINIKDGSILMSVTVTATQTSQTIQSVKVELRGLPIKKPGSSNKKMISSYKLLGEIENTGEFVVDPGISKILNFTLPNDTQKVLQKNYDYSAKGNKFVRAVKEFMHSFEIIDPNLFEYVIVATATVKDLKLKPEDTASIKLLSVEN